MATRLWNILTFTGVAPGATVSLPHLLNSNGNPLVPDFGWVNGAVFAPVADDTNVTITNTSLVIDSVNILVASLHTTERVLGGDLNMTPQPYWQIGFGFGGGASPLIPSRPTLVYQPGGPLAGPGTFNTWAGIMAQLVAYRATANGGGQYTIVFDNTFVDPGPMIIPPSPPGSPYDLSEVILSGRHQFTQLDPTANWVQIADGAHFIGMRSIAHLRLENMNTVSAADESFGYIPNDLVDIDIGSTVYSTGAAPLWEATPAQPGDALATVIKFSDVGTIGPGFVFHLPNPGVFLVNETAYAAVTGEFFVSGVVGSSMLLAKGSASGTLASSYPGFLGTIALNPQWSIAGLRPDPFNAPPFTAPTPNPPIGSLIRFDASGGPIAQILPPISSVVTTPNQLGGMIAFVELSGLGGPVTLTPDVGDTIQGGLIASLVVPLGGSVLLTSDGISDWDVLSIFDPAISTPTVRYSPPEQWTQSNVAAGQANVALSAQVSTNFNNIPMIRAGSIVGLSTRLTQAVTAGTLTVQVTINGAGGTLAIVHVAPSTGSQVTQAAGIDTFVAGDLLGVRLTTDGGFTPNTTDLEAWLQITEAP